MRIDFTDMISMLKIQNTASNMSKNINETLSNCVTKFLQSKNHLVVLQMNRNWYISTHSCELTILVCIAVH